MSIERTLFSLAIASSFAICTGVYAQTSDSANAMQVPTMSATRVDAKDQMFFKKAAIGGMTEVEAGKLAVANSSSPDIKSFGQQMIDDHTKVNDQLKTLAAQKSVTLPDSPDAKHEAMLTSLKAKQGAAFDTAFIKDMQMGHTDAIKAFSSASHSNDSDVATFATKTLPELQEHQKMLATLKPAMKTGSADSAAVAAR